MGSDFIDWLGDRAEREEYGKLVLLALIMMYLLYIICYLFITVFANQHMVPGVIRTSAQAVSGNSIPIISVEFFYILAKGAILEETFFRVIPLTIVIIIALVMMYLLHMLSWRFIYLDEYRIAIKAALVATLFLSIIFGYIHGNVLNIFIQGWGGIAYSILFLKCGGGQFKSLWSMLTGIYLGFSTVVWTQLLFNISLNLISFWLGMRYVTIGA
jgi:hypothetical protein